MDKINSLVEEVHLSVCESTLPWFSRLWNLLMRRPWDPAEIIFHGPRQSIFDHYVETWTCGSQKYVRYRCLILKTNSQLRCYPPRTVPDKLGLSSLQNADPVSKYFLSMQSRLGKGERIVTALLLGQCRKWVCSVAQSVVVFLIQIMSAFDRTILPTCIDITLSALSGLE